ncbi:unnamed protein product [Trypanosoma congolense IL3000]|uniref:WGS project CAEQ00000000 data, annotated contig 2360 n=1 Tax=Trypanosoma congolense (strain IL3000) TaxID=1068625 RepID=F9WDG6_TRYCI|nr:unnamed protein product [Trypanosoma congolense IL3000]
MESFSPFRVVGSVCGELPLSSTVLYGAPVLMVATGHTFQLFRGKELSMLRGGPHFEKTVRAVAQAGKYRFVAEGPRIHAFVHHKPLWTLLHSEITKCKVNHLLAVDDILFCVGQDKRIVVREVKSGRALGDFLVENSEDVRAIAVPTGYNNKLLLGSAEGSLQLYNFRSGECLWHSRRSGGAQITSLAVSNYKDIVAYGTSHGHTVVLNLATGEEIMSFDQEEKGAVTALAFRADKEALVTGSSTGEVAIWDLENRCLDGLLTRSKQVKSEAEVLDNPHTNAVHSIVVLPTETTTIVTAGADNALLQFRFDTVDGLGLLVRERRGHMGGCTEAQFYNNDLLITAGLDRSLRVTHVFSDRASWELSQGQLGRRGREKQMGREALKMPPAIALSSCTSRNYQWSSVVSLHEASAKMCGWRMDTRVLDCKISGIKTSMHTARSVAMSGCGNYAIVGYSSGNVAVISIQNKGIRQLFDASLRPDDCAHVGSVECVEVACGNSIIVTAGLDSNIKLWSLVNCRLRTVIKADCPVHKSCIHQLSSLLITAQHFLIRVYHCNPDVGFTAKELRSPVRTFEGHASPITAVALAPDSYRYVVSASSDAALFVWDLASSACVGQYRMPSPAISLNFHPDALFMVSTHVGERGAFLWSNNLRYGFVPEVVTDPKARTVDRLPLLHFPTSHGAMEDEEEDGTAVEKKFQNGDQRLNKEFDGSDDEAVGELTDTTDMTAREGVQLFDAKKDAALAQIEREERELAKLNDIISGGLRLSGVPRSIWFNLTLLEQIKEKNQPLLPPKKRDIPFFLPSTQELRPTFLVAAPAVKDKNCSTPASRIVGAALTDLTTFQKMLVDKDYDATVSYILSLSTAQAVDLEIKRSIDYSEGCTYTKEELEKMKSCLRGLLSFVVECLKRRDNVDLVQGILASVIRSHGTLITRCGAELLDVIEELTTLQNSIRYAVDHLVSYPSCLAGTFSGTHF